MVQIKIITVKELATLDAEINGFLATLKDDAAPSINIDIEKGVGTIIYTVNAEWKGRLCCECQYWDDGGEPTTSGLCHECGKRRRFNCKACECFKDVRG